MWKIITLVVAVTLFASGSLMAQEKPVSDATKKQVEELTAIRARTAKKLDDFRKSMAAGAAAASPRYTAVQAAYQTARANQAKKLEAETAKTPRDDAALNAINAKIQKMDDAVAKNLAKVWANYNTFINDQNQLANYFSTLESMATFSDNWVRLDMDLQVLNKLVLAYDARLDAAQIKANEVNATVAKTLDEAEAACKE